MESIRPAFRASGRPGRLRRRRRMGVDAATAKVLGTSVDAVVPLQRHSPRLVLAVSLAELAATAALIATGGPAEMVALVAVSAGLVAVVVTNTRRVLALTPMGNVVLTASTSGRPIGVAGPAGEPLTLPRPSGVGVTMAVAGDTWWVDRSSYRWLDRARAVRKAGTGG